MSDHARPGWVLPVLLAVATSVAAGFAFLYLARPNASELGAIRVVVSDDAGKPGSTVHVVVAEAPFVQSEPVTPGAAFAGVVHYPAPYRVKPHLKLTPGKRPYEVVTETEMGFTWRTLPLQDDFKEDPKREAGLMAELLRTDLATAAATGKLKPGLTFEEFRWEAKGLRAPPSSLPPTPFEQKGDFNTVIGQEGMVGFPLPYDGPPNVQFSGNARSTVVTEVTPKFFKWRNSGRDAFFDNGTVSWTARGVRGGP